MILIRRNLPGINNAGLADIATVGYHRDKVQGVRDAQEETAELLRSSIFKARDGGHIYQVCT